MRIIHTADWHLGQYFMGKNREAEHKAFLDWLLSVIKEQQIDALILAGDVYDTGAPPSYARQMFNRFVGDCKDAGCQLVVVGGNHDSVAMLEESTELLQRLGVHLVAKPADDPLDQVVRVPSGKSNNPPAVLVCAVPFLRPRYIVKSVAGESASAKQQQLQSAIASHYKAVYEAAVKLKEDNQWHCPIIVTGHLTAVGASRSKSVRDIYIGTLEAFPANGFPPADYIALGHIHGAQKVAGSDVIRYSGSPIPLSFDETGRGGQKSVMQLTINADAKIELETLVIPQYRSLRVIRGSLDTIEQQLIDLPIEDDAPTTWLEVIVDTHDYLNDLQQRIAELLEGRNAEVLLLKRQRTAPSESNQASQQQTLSELSAEDMFERRLQEEFVVEDSDVQNKELQNRLRILYRQVVNDVCREEAP